MNNNVDYKVQILAGHRIISDKQVYNQFNYNGEYAIETHNGDFVLVGATESQDVDILNPRGSYDIWVIKIDAKGNLLWEKSSMIMRKTCFCGNTHSGI